MKSEIGVMGIHGTFSMISNLLFQQVEISEIAVSWFQAVTPGRYTVATSGFTHFSEQRFFAAGLTSDGALHAHGSVKHNAHTRADAKQKYTYDKCPVNVASEASILERYRSPSGRPR